MSHNNIYFFKKFFQDLFRHKVMSTKNNYINPRKTENNYK